MAEPRRPSSSSLLLTPRQARSAAAASELEASSPPSPPVEVESAVAAPSIDYELDMAQTKQQLAAKEARIGQLLRQLDAERALLNAKLQECSTYAERMRNLQSDFDQSVSAAGHWQAQAGEAQEKLAAALQEQAATSDKNGMLNRMLKKAQEDSRASVAENAMLKESLRVATIELEEMRAKYGMLGDVGDERVRRAIDRGRDAVQENAELKQRLIGKNVQVTELSERLARLQEEIDPLVDQVQALRIAKEELAADNRQLRQQLESLQQAARKLRTQKQQLKQQASGVQEDLRLYIEEKAAAEQHARLAQQESSSAAAQIDRLQRERAQLLDSVKLAVLRHELQHKDLEIAREEKKAKDKQIRELRDNLSYLNQKVMQLMPSEAAAAAAPILSPHLEDEPSIRKLREQLELSISACRAHQSQNAYLAQEISRLEREHAAHIELKDTTIQRLARELDLLRAALASTISDQAQPSSSSSSSSLSSSSSPVENDVQQQASIEDLRTEMDAMKKAFFFTLVQSIKLTAMQAGTPITADATALYELLQQQNVPYLRWSEWIQFQLDQKPATSSTRSFVSSNNRWKN